MRLKNILTIAFALLGALAVAAASALVLLSTLLHRAVAETTETLESVRLAQSMEIRLLDHERATDTLTRRSAAGELRQMAIAARGHAASSAELTLVQQNERRVQAYLEGTEAEPVLPEAERAALFEAAVAGVHELVQVNVEESRSLRRAALTWDRWGNALGGVLAIVTVIGVGVVLLWLRASTRPAIELGAAIDRLASGEKAIRAPEHGPLELRTIARQFNRMAEALDRQSQSRLTFLAAVAHELRNPLGALKLAAGSFPAGTPLPAEDRIRKTMERIHRQVVRLDRMVWDFLDASRVEAGVLDLRLEDCDLRGLADNVVDLFAPVSPGHRIVLSASAEPVLARCDPLRVEQVLTNLVSNAIKYSPGGGVVEVGVERECGVARVTVADQGLGIRAEDIAGLFEPFRRGAGSSQAIPGVGLGLFVTRRIVEAHGGSIQVETTAASGSRFHVRLPAADPRMAPPD